MSLEEWFEPRARVDGLLSRRVVYAVPEGGWRAGTPCGTRSGSSRGSSRPSLLPGGGGLLQRRGSLLACAVQDNCPILKIVECSRVPGAAAVPAGIGGAEALPPPAPASEPSMLADPSSGDNGGGGTAGAAPERATEELHVVVKRTFWLTDGRVKVVVARGEERLVARAYGATCIGCLIAGSNAYGATCIGCLIAGSKAACRTAAPFY